MKKTNEENDNFRSTVFLYFQIGAENKLLSAHGAGFSVSVALFGEDCRSEHVCTITINNK